MKPQLGIPEHTENGIMRHGSVLDDAGKAPPLGRLVEEDLRTFPGDVVDDLGYALSVVQHGRRAS